MPSNACSPLRRPPTGAAFVRQLTAYALLAVTSCAYAGPSERGAEQQWLTRSHVSLKGLVNDGYAVVGVQLIGNNVIWYFLQSGNSVYRCAERLRTTGLNESNVFDCRELVQPHTNK